MAKDTTVKKSVADLANRWFRRRPESLTELETKVLQSAIDHKPVARDTSLRELGLGDRIADTMARIGGSWTFILAFLAFLFVWTVGNAWLLGRDSFDPYPFIFLNLVLSMLAALQAPVIMMSQNRQAERDRIDAKHDYAVNLKAEIEIMALHEKLDELRHSQMMGMRNEIDRIAECVKRLEDRMLTAKWSNL